jgi:hypothetical protein
MDLGMEIKVIFGTVFEMVSRIFVVVSRKYTTICTSDYGHEKSGMKKVGQ